MKASIYNKEGKAAGSVDLPEAIFDIPWNADLVHQVVVSMQANARVPYAHTKDRSEVSGGGRKPWRQKGTGQARHGSRRSPIWKGGGVTFGPRKEKDYSKKINKKMRAKALYAVLSQKLKDNEILFVDHLAFEKPKTKEAKQALVSLSSVPSFDRLTTKPKNAALIALPEKSTSTEQSFRNIKSVSVDEVRNLNPVKILAHKYLVIADPAKAIEFLETKPLTGKATDKKLAAKKAAPKKVAPKKTVAKKAIAKKTARKTVKK